MKKREIDEIKRQRDNLADMVLQKERELAAWKARAIDLNRHLREIVRAVERRDRRALERAVNKAKVVLI